VGRRRGSGGAARRNIDYLPLTAGPEGKKGEKEKKGGFKKKKGGRGTCCRPLDTILFFLRGGEEGKRNRKKREEKKKRKPALLTPLPSHLRRLRNARGGQKITRSMEKEGSRRTELLLL